MTKLMVMGILIGAAGIAGAAPAAKTKPKLTFGEPTAGGAQFDAKLVSTTVKKSSDALLACYTKALVKAPELKGTATVKFTIDATGKLTAANATGLNQEAESCIATTLSKITLAKPKDGKSVDITYLLTFEPAAAEPDPEQSGGFGYGVAGTGPGGGCTGWGTIGTGRYGTIGHGSGYGVGGGCGGGGMRARTNAVPTISIGQPTVKGDLDKAIIRRYIKRNIQKLQYCYEKELLAKPGLKGTVTVAFTIAPTGLVATSSATGLKNKNVETCMADVIKSIEFPKPKTASDVVVAYPFTLREAGG